MLFPGPGRVAALIEAVVADYLAAEALHGGTLEAHTAPAIELF